MSSYRLVIILFNMSWFLNPHRALLRIHKHCKIIDSGLWLNVMPECQNKKKISHTTCLHPTGLNGLWQIHFMSVHLSVYLSININLNHVICLSTQGTSNNAHVRVFIFLWLKHLLNTLTFITLSAWPWPRVSNWGYGVFVLLMCL